MANGYGSMGLDNITVYPHRLAYELAHGSIPEGLSVLHECDIRLCVRPEHLYAGTQGQNIRDAVRRGRLRPPRPEARPFAPAARGRRGEDSVRAKLTEDDIREIRRLYAAGDVEQKTLAERFQTDISNISLIVTRKNWRHVL